MSGDEDGRRDGIHQTLCTFNHPRYQEDKVSGRHKLLLLMRRRPERHLDGRESSTKTGVVGPKDADPVTLQQKENNPENKHAPLANAEQYRNSIAMSEM